MEKNNLTPYDLISVLHASAVKAVEVEEDKRLLKEMWAIVCVDNLMQALKNIPNTRWKKCKYYVNSLFGRNTYND